MTDHDPSMCPVCPALEPGVPCVIARTGHAPYWRWATSGDQDLIDWLVAESLRQAVADGADTPHPPTAPEPLAAEDAAARRASKPRVPLGTPHCQPCAEEEARRRAEAGRDQIGSGR